MRISTSHFDQPIRQNRLCSRLDAESAVQAGVSLEDYLIHRLSRDQAQGRHSRFPQKFYVVIEQGMPIKIPNPDENRIWEQLRDDPTSEDAPERYKIQSQQQEIARKLEELDDQIFRLNHIGRQVSDQQEAVEAEQVERIGRGEMEGPTTKARRDRTRRRPWPPIPWGPVAGYLVLVLLILCEAYQFVLPLLDSMGVDTSDLSREWKKNPLGVLNGAGFALAASAGLFFLWHQLISLAVTLSRSWDLAAPLVLARRVAGIVLLSCGLLVGTILMANMRHGATIRSNDFQAVQHDQAAASDMGTGVFVFLTLIVPCTAAALNTAIGRSSYWQRRHEIASQQAEFDREEEARLVPAESVADCLALLQQQLDKIEQDRSRLQQERRALADQTTAVEQERIDKLEHARWCTLVYAKTLFSALQQDRYYFLRAAIRSKAFHLLPSAARVDQHEPKPPRQFVHPLLTDASNGHRA